MRQLTTHPIAPAEAVAGEHASGLSGQGGSAAAVIPVEQSVAALQKLCDFRVLTRRLLSRKQAAGQRLPEPVARQVQSDAFDVPFSSLGHKLVVVPARNEVAVRLPIRRLDNPLELQFPHLRVIANTHGALWPMNLRVYAAADPPTESEKAPQSESQHRLAAGALVLAKSVLSGLHHAYSIATANASA